MRKLSRIRKQNNEMEKLLSCYNLQHYYIILRKLRALSLNEYHQEQIRQDILELICQAQNRGDTINDTIGSDFEEFVASISDSVPRQTKSEECFINFSNFLTVAQYMLIFFTLWKIKNTGLTTITYNVINLLYFCGIIPLMTLKFIKYLIAQEWSVKAILSATVLSSLMMLPVIAIKVLNYDTLFIISSPTWLFIGLIFIVVWINWKIQKHIDIFYYTEL